jgi:hypothetical protein
MINKAKGSALLGSIWISIRQTKRSPLPLSGHRAVTTALSGRRRFWKLLKDKYVRGGSGWTTGGWEPASDAGFGGWCREGELNPQGY